MGRKMKKYRVVHNHHNDEVIVSSIIGNSDFRLNGDAGVILHSLQNKDCSVEEVKHHYPEFFDFCEKHQLINKDKIDFCLSSVNTAYHLKRVQIELTRLCNLNCSYCYSSSGPFQKSKLEFKDVIQLIDDAFDLGCLWVDFTGGEPLGYKGWEEIFTYTAQKGMVVSIHSNGVLLTEANVKKLKSAGVRKVQVSLDSHIPEVHDEARKLKGAYLKSTTGIQNCLNANIPVIISMVAHKGNQDHFVEAVEYLGDKFKSKVLIDRVIKAGSEISTGVGLPNDVYFSLIQPLIRKGIVEAKVCDNFVVNDIKVEPLCGVAHSFLYITAEGEIALCPTMTSRDNPELFNSPQLPDFSLKQAWTESPYVLKYRGLNCKNVNKCPAAKGCGGGCRSNAYIESDELDAPDLVSCNVHKNFTGTYVNFNEIYNKKLEA